MRIVQVQTTQEARRLQAQLIPADLEGVERDVREHELRMMNPALDLQAVKVGDVVLVPDDLVDVGEAALKPNFTEHASIAERVAPVREVLDRVIAQEADEREIIRRDLSGRVVREAAEQDPAIAAQVERVREQLSQDVRDARVREQQLTELVERATADLDELKARFGLS
jgi:hypothetical protein